jgi:hypothetical protein
MKLTELATPKKSRQVAKVFESYFGTKMPVNRLTLREAQAMLKRVRGVIAEHQRGTGRHTSERNPAYLKLVMMEQALGTSCERRHGSSSRYCTSCTSCTWHPCRNRNHNTTRQSAKALLPMQPLLLPHKKTLHSKQH